MTLVKVCGLRTLTDARAAVRSGADWIGFIFWRPGKRFVAPSDAAQILRSLRAEALAFSSVGVFVDPSPEEVDEAVELCGLDYVQLSGEESAATLRSMPRPTIKTIHVHAGREAAAAELVLSDAFGAHRYLLDTHAEGLRGGTGVAFDWAALQIVGPRCLVAGGLRPDNVTQALETLAPLGVDVSSGVEFPATTTQTDASRKDPQLIHAFLEAVRSYDIRPK